MRIVHDEGGFIFGTVTDNLSINQKSFKTIRESYTPNTIDSVEHPISNNHSPSILAMCNATHLMKDLRNNWISEKKWLT